MRNFDFKNLIENVREQTDIVQVIGCRVDLDRHDKALCPFHQEKTPSFSVNAKEQYFHCFGCGAGGDVFKFLELYENKPFMQVFSELAGQAGINLPAVTEEDKQRIEETCRVEDILKETATFYHQNITPEVKAYLTGKRGLTEETISRFKIGYAKGGLREHLIEKCKLPIDLCIKAGVVKETDGGTVRDYFYHRIIFPNLKRGRVVHLSGRSLDGQEPKYLHLPGEIRYLYNEDALYHKEIYIAEGIPDCLSAVQFGFPAVAILGASSFKPEYLNEFSHCETIYLCLDGDEAGKEGALRIGGLIGERAKIIQLPEGVDLNDYLKEHPKEDFEILVRSAKDIIKYELNLIPLDTDKTELPQRLEPILKKLARMQKAKAEAYLSYEIKPRFKLKKEDIDGYRDLVNEYRKGGEEAPTVQGANLGTKPVYTALLDGLVDLVGHHGTPAFLMKEGDKLFILPQVEKDGILYIPPPKEQIPWLLPRGEETLKYYELEEELSPRESDGALYNDLIVYFKAISELPTEEYYDLLTSWVLHTYFLEVIQYSPIICLFAVPERGKTRTGKGLVYLAYRGIHVESLRDAYLVRIANNFRSTIFFDVKDIWRKAEKTGSSDILLLRFEKGATVPRVLYPERGAFNDTVYYTIFGPTIVGTNESVHKILESRALTINMPESRRRFENDVTPEISLPLKERLLAFRARHLGETFPDIPKPTAGRLGDILKPLLQVIRLVKPEREETLRKLGSELESERKIDKVDSLEAQILAVIMGLENEVELGTLPVKTIADSLNQDKLDKSRVSYQRVGRRLNAMGFKKARVGNNVAILWDKEKVRRMADTYGLTQTHETHEKDETLDQTK